MKLQDLLYKVNILKVVGTTNIVISDIQFDSRKIKREGLFVAIKGIISDGHQYIQNTIKDGAIAIIVEQIPIELNDKITYIQVSSSYNALAVIAANFYKNPSERTSEIVITNLS